MPEKTGASRPKKTRKKKKTFFRNFINFIKYVVFGFNRYATRTDVRAAKSEFRVFGRRITFPGFLCIMLALILVVLLALNDRSVSVAQESIIVTGLSVDMENYRILLISDLCGKNFGQDQSSLIRSIGSLKYDMVVLAGDMIGSNGDPAPLYALIEGLGSKPVYFIAGDSDPNPLLDKPRDNSSQTLTLNQMVYADWVLGAIERGAIYVDAPIKITVKNAVMWLMPEKILNLNVTDTFNLFKEEMATQTESLASGVLIAYDTLPLANYRYNVMSKCNQYIGSVSPSDLIVMLTHEPPLDSQILVSQDVMTVQEMKDYYPSPDIILGGHYCGGDWKIPGYGAVYIPSKLSARYGWFPEQKYVQGQRTVGSTIVYVTPGLSTSGDTLFGFRFMNPPQASIITLTGELPSSFLD